MLGIEVLSPEPPPLPLDDWPEPLFPLSDDPAFSDPDDEFDASSGVIVVRIEK
jgi:hypothetical protein